MLWSHHMYQILLDNKLYVAPIEEPKVSSNARSFQFLRSISHMPLESARYWLWNGYLDNV
jgi:hypothetical protein